MKKIIAAVVAIICVLAILVVCAIVFKPEAENNNDIETTDTTGITESTRVETEPETWEPGYVEEETWEGPEIEID